MHSGMATEHPFVGAYWTAREETRIACAGRIAAFLRSLAGKPLLSRWYLKGRSRTTAVTPLDLTVEGIAKKLRQNHTDIPRRPIPDLGFSLGIWNGDDEASAGLMLKCGAYSTWVGNSVVLSLPRQEPPNDAAALARFRELVEKIAAAFDPDVAVPTSSELNARGGRTVRENEAWSRYERGRGIVTA
jgi:hypothetical protein